MTTSDTKEAPSLNGSAKEKSTQASTETSPPPKRDANWPRILYFLYLHPLALCALYLGITDACWSTLIFGLAVILVSLLGVTAGAHRLWAHKAYKASTKLKILLMLAHTLAGQGTIYEWVKQHRKHHKYFGTHKDPHNPKRGFLYAHFLSNLQKKTEQDEKDIKEIDMSDIDKDDVVMFQKKYYWIIFIIVSIILPLNTPLEYWDESLMNSVLIIAVFRFTIMLHAVWFIHSSTLVWGLQPNDKYPADTNLVFVLTKTFWPQYHYLLPWDYQTGEYGTYGTGCSTIFIRVAAAFGWATDLRTIDSEAVKAALGTSLNTGLPLDVCLANAANSAQYKLPEDHYLDHEKYK